MTPSDITRFTRAISVLFETLGYPMTPARLEGFRLALDDMDVADIERACFVGMRSLKFQPKPADLRELAGVTDISIDDRAQIAWRSVREQIQRTSGMSALDFDDPIIHATIRDLGGWERVSGLSSDELTRFTSRDFATAYAVFARHPETLSEEATRYLPGCHDGNCDPRFAHRLPAPERIRTGLPPLIEAKRPRLLEGKAS